MGCSDSRKTMNHKNLFSEPNKNDLVVLPVANPKQLAQTVSGLCLVWQTQTKLFAQSLLGQKKDSVSLCRTLWLFCRKHSRYEADPPSYEHIRSPNRLMTDGRGDCEDYVVFCSTTLLNLNISHTIRLADYGAGYQHIYIVINKTVLDPVSSTFNEEPKYVHKYDIVMSKKSASVNGFGQQMSVSSKVAPKSVGGYTKIESLLVQTYEALRRHGFEIYKKREGVYCFAKNVAAEYALRVIYYNMPECRPEATGSGCLAQIIGKSEIRFSLGNFSTGKTEVVQFVVKDLPQLVYEIGGRYNVEIDIDTTIDISFDMPKSVGMVDITRQNYFEIAAKIDFKQLENPVFRRLAVGMHSALSEGTENGKYWKGYEVNRDQVEEINSYFRLLNQLASTNNLPMKGGKTLAASNPNFALKIAIAKAKIKIALL